MTGFLPFVLNFKFPDFPVTLREVSAKQSSRFMMRQTIMQGAKMRRKLKLDRISIGATFGMYPFMIFSGAKT